MVNKNLLDLAKRTGNKDLPKQEIPEPITFSRPEFLNPSFLTGDLAKSVYDEYKKTIETEYHNADALNVLTLDSDLERKLLVVNAGLEVDSGMPHGVKPIVLLGVTQIYSPEILQVPKGQQYKFEYGFDEGVPRTNEVGNGNRTFFMPNRYDLGLRCLFRGGNLDLDARGVSLSSSDSGGRVNIARQKNLLGK